MRTLVLLTLVGLAAGAILTPTAAATPCPAHLDCHLDCIQVYPWSRLCQGDVVGFVEAFTGPLGALLQD